MSKRITVSGVGCCLVDRLYNHISFQSGVFVPCLTRTKGDGGLTPGQLVFKEEFDRFTGKDFMKVLPELTGGRSAETLNIGGPCIVALIHAAQMTGDRALFRFYGCHGDDADGQFILSALQKTPVDTGRYRLEKDAITASTIVLSDPDYDHGNGERIFINTIGASRNFQPEELDEAFFASDMVVFGGTAIVPQIHDGLEHSLARARENNCFTVVNTVFDFRSEKAHPDKKWPLGKDDSSYRYIDLLIADHEEALRLSGKSTTGEALAFFRAQGTGAVVITNGAGNISLLSTGKRFAETAETSMPVSGAVTQELRKGAKGDTTGCGDNFAGGIIASVVDQLQHNTGLLDLKEACRWGIVSGGFACFYMGGTWLEEFPGEKRQRIQPYYDLYKKQTE